VKAEVLIAGIAEHGILRDVTLDAILVLDAPNPVSPDVAVNIAANEDWNIAWVLAVDCFTSSTEADDRILHVKLRARRAVDTSTELRRIPDESAVAES